jgi:hypothetical protein
MKEFQETMKLLPTKIFSASSLRFPKTGKIREIGMVLRFNVM